jgi:hypothetical protein
MRVCQFEAVDRLVQQRFPSLGVTVDEFFVHPDRAAAFAREVQVRAPGDFTIPEVLRRVLVLRKRGKSKGGI